MKVVGEDPNPLISVQSPASVFFGGSLSGVAFFLNNSASLTKGYGPELQWASLRMFSKFCFS